MKGKAPHTLRRLNFKIDISKYQRIFERFLWNWIYSKISGKLAINYNFQISNYEPNKFKICSKRLNVGHENPKTENCWKFCRSKILEGNGNAESVCMPYVPMAKTYATYWKVSRVKEHDLNEKKLGHAFLSRYFVDWDKRLSLSQHEVQKSF